MENNMIAVSADRYEKLLAAEIQRDMLLNIVQNVASYNVKDYIKAAFNLDIAEPDD